MHPPSFYGLRLEVDEQERIGHLELARPDKLNAFCSSMWSDFAQVRLTLNIHENIVLCSRGGSYLLGILKHKRLIEGRTITLGCYRLCSG